MVKQRFAIFQREKFIEAEVHPFCEEKKNRSSRGSPFQQPKKVIEAEVRLCEENFIQAEVRFCKKAKKFRQRSTLQRWAEEHWVFVRCPSSSRVTLRPFISFLRPGVTHTFSLSHTYTYTRALLTHITSYASPPLKTLNSTPSFSWLARG
ncbi:hypothetical protein DM02DRAFT_7223 [Periconia macrospinosa]|uniref:Uncharacterized protein n=1 Tax=Periconia macrospinosa TaxID=97972 RepID=A0A2V1EEW5_9PLEO|nr:hypothetical protein DM02DRAFT_7223 [Periconia macrospinosa]